MHLIVRASMRRPTFSIVLLCGLCALAQSCSSGSEAGLEANNGASVDPDPFEPPPDDPNTPEPDAMEPDPAVVPPDPDNDSLGLPCDVSHVLAEHCWSCHGTTPRYGAPMPLVTWADLHAPVPVEPGMVVGEPDPMYKLVVERMTETQRPMPPPPNPSADEAEIELMRVWSESGAKAGEVCDDAPEIPDDGMDQELPPPHEDCDHVFELRAHGQGVPGDETPYMVPPLEDLYVNFSFQVPWTGSAHAVSFHPIVDDDRVLHHYLLYTSPLGGALANGSIVPGIGMHPGEALVAGWAPGGLPSVMPDNVGLEMPNGPTGRMILEIHYHNETGETVPDTSGVRVCVTTNKRPETAAVSLLGTELIVMPLPGEYSFTGICTPVLNVLAQEPVHILTSSPHLHKRGRHLTTRIHRLDGSIEILHDAPFDFDNQIIYETPATIYPGDWLTTTCTYENTGGPAVFGIRTEDEMCQNYLTAWPAGLLDTGGSIILSAHACML